jgi:hypothetical protein
MEIFAQCPAYAVHRIFEGLGENPLFETRVAVEGVPVVGVQKTTIRTFAVSGEEETEGLRPHILGTKTPDFVHVYRGLSLMNKVFFHTSAACPRMPHLSRENLSKRLINTNTCNRSLFFAPKLREPHFGRTKALTPEQAEELRALRAAGVTLKDLMYRSRLGKTAVYRYLVQDHETYCVIGSRSSQS